MSVLGLPEWAPGQVLGYYRLIWRLREDALGQVWRAEHQAFRRPVILRILPAGLVAPNAGVKLQPYIKLEHPHILTLVDFRTGDGPPYTIYRFAEGTRLDEFMAQGRLPWPSAAEIARQLLLALGAIHGRAGAYGRLSPCSILVTADSQVLLADLGAQHAIASEHLPDLLAEDPFTPPDPTPCPAGDLWSLGTLLWAMVGGQAPQAQGSPLRELVPGTPAALDEFIAHCKAGIQHGVALSADQLAAELAEVISQELQAPEEEVREVVLEMAEPVEGSVESPGASPDEPALEPTPAAASAPAWEATAETAEAWVGAGVPHQEAEPRPISVEALEARLLRLQRERPRTLSRGQIDAEIEGLRECIGRTLLAPLSKVRCTAVLRRVGTQRLWAALPYAMVCMAGGVGLWWALRQWVATTDLPSAMQRVVALAALGCYLAIALWLAAGLGLTRTSQPCLADFREEEVLCWSEKGHILLERIPARVIKTIAIDEPEPGALCRGSVRIDTREGGTYILDFQARERPQPM